MVVTPTWSQRDRPQTTVDYWQDEDGSFIQDEDGTKLLFDLDSAIDNQWYQRREDV